MWLRLVVGGGVGRSSWCHVGTSLFVANYRWQANRQQCAMRALSPRTTIDDWAASPPGNDTMDHAPRRWGKKESREE